MYENAQFSTIADLFTKLNTFASANGWTVNHSATDRLFLTKGSCSVAFRWSSSSPTCVGIYQHTAFVSSGTDPGNHTNDSGQGAVSGTDATLLTGRRALIPNTGGQYWFFEDDTYLHIVVENSPQVYTHFGFGILLKAGTWTGGAYSYGSRDVGTGSANIDVLSSFSLDGFSSTSPVVPFLASVNVGGLPNQAGSGKWGLCWAGGAVPTNDRGGNARANLQGGFRGGPQARALGRFSGSPQNGLIPFYPVTVYYDDPSNARWYYLGRMPDVRGVNVKSFVGGDEVLIGSDTWVIFPVRFKSSVSTNGTTRNQGIAYKKVTT